MTPKRVNAHNVIGLLLLTAAGLKTHELCTGLVAGDGFLTSRWFLIAVVEIELLLGLFLLAGVFPLWTWRVAVATFSLFAVAAISMAVAGYESCGCFGRVKVNPWWSFAVDLGVLAALLRWRPSSDDIVPIAHLKLRLGMLGGLFILVGTPSTYLMATYKPAVLAVDGVTVGEGKLVILEPAKWIGHPFPIRSFIDVGAQLTSGTCAVLLYHHGCPKCEEALPQYEQLAASQEPNDPRIALIEVPPYGHSHRESAGRLLHGRLSEQKEWFVKAPIEILLEDGKVTQVSSDLAFLRSSPAVGENFGRALRFREQASHFTIDD